VEGKAGAGPTEQLLLTDNDSDYLWYEANVPSTTAGAVDVKTKGGAIAYSYVDGKLQTPGDMTSTTEATSKISILSVAMGLSNGGVGPGSVKGLDSLMVGGKDLTRGDWTYRWMLQGESQRIYSKAGAAAVKWAPKSALGVKDGLIWLKSTFDLPTNTTTSPVQGQQTAYALDLSSMVGGKGVAYVNGFNIGRYWCA
jgi:hypothetical protein